MSYSPHLRLISVACLFKLVRSGFTAVLKSLIRVMSETMLDSDFRSWMESNFKSFYLSSDIMADQMIDMLLNHMQNHSFKPESHDYQFLLVLEKHMNFQQAVKTIYHLSRHGLKYLDALKPSLRVISHLVHRFKLNPKLVPLLIKLGKYCLTVLYELEKDKLEIQL